jgi:hypothetical protein
MQQCKRFDDCQHCAASRTLICTARTTGSEGNATELQEQLRNDLRSCEQHSVQLKHTHMAAMLRYLGRQGCLSVVDRTCGAQGCAGLRCTASLVQPATAAEAGPVRGS